MVPWAWGMACFMLMYSFGTSFAQTTPTDVQKFKSQADALEDQSAQAIDDGNIHLGLELMGRSVNLDPAPARRMNYGGMLYGDGIEIFENIDQHQGLVILQKAESQLRLAIAAFNPDQDQIYLSQCYFILGKIYMDAYTDPAKAKEYFKRAIDFSNYTGAESALNRLSQ